MKKQILSVIGILAIAASILAGCSQNSADTDATTQTTTQATTKTVAVNTTVAETTTVSDESTTVSTTVNKESAASTTRAASKTTEKKTSSTTAKRTTKVAAKSTTKKTTTKKQTTTKKKTTTKKNVTAAEVQSQVNAYIRSKGYTVDTSLRPNNSGWSGEISGLQEDLNNGDTLRNCKGYVDIEIANGYPGMALYCYYQGNDFYILYL